jgi:hypothetical protein
MKRFALVSLMFAVITPFAVAEVTVKQPWVRATVAQQKATGAFMQISSSQDARLVEFRSPLAGVVELHEMVMDNGVMRMRAITALELPAGKTVTLGPGSYHLMLLDLKAQMKEGDSVPLILVIEARDKKRETLEVNAPVRALTAGPDGHKP